MRRLAASAAALVACLASLGLPLPAQATPGPGNGPEYWFDTWQLTSLWNDGARGQGVRIAEVDTGVNASLPELRGRVLAGTDLGAGGNGQIDRDKNPFGHGTAMASIMVGRPGPFDITGVAPDARILPVAVPLSGTTDAPDGDRLATAIRWSANHGARIISMSLGGVQLRRDGPACPADVQSAVYYALRKGAVLFAAAGNRAASGSPVESPAVCLGVVAVGAVNRSGTVASFSTRNPYVALTAPGVDVPSIGRTGSGYSGDGTSQATALTSAVAALVWSKHPQLSGRQLVARLLATLDPRRTARSSSYGYGQLDAYAAVTAAVPADAPDPVYALAQPFAARARALAAAPGEELAPPPTGRRNSPGRFRIGAPPETARMGEVVGAAVAGAGLLGLLVLGGQALRRRPQGGAAHEPTDIAPVV